MDWQENQDSSMVERQARDLEVRVRVPVQVQIFLLKFNNEIIYTLTHFIIMNLQRAKDKNNIF